MSRPTLLSLGSNVAGSWGKPLSTLRRAVKELENCGIETVCVARIYRSRPMGLVRQPAFLNTAILVRTNHMPRAVVSIAKTLEWRAGRRRSQRWGPRPLDIDLIDYKGIVIGWPPSPQARPPLVLPHPEAHRRSFVLAPIAEIAPEWRHPVAKVSAARLLADNPPSRDELTAVLDSDWYLCDTTL